ncbi:MAG: AI-2E family transporter [Eubacteriales bacterium]
MKERSVRKSMLLIAFTLILAWMLWNYQWFWSMIQSGSTVSAPFVVGLAMAFILNILVTFLEKPMAKKLPKLARPLAIVFALVLIAAALLILMVLIIPQIGLSFQMVGQQMPTLWANALSWIADTATHYNLDLSRLETLQIDWVALSNTVVSFFQEHGSDLIGTTVSATSSVFTGLLNFFLGLIFAIYILLQKETLYRQSTRLLRACIPQKWADLFLRWCSVAATIFRSFVSGQLIEAVIIGVLCFVGMAILQFPYAAMISALIGFTALIPIVGAFIGTIVGAFLILMVSPMQALWFVIFLLVLQQLEGNLIYPKVVGKSVGLPGLWVLFAITIGASLGGVMGMLLAVPICSFVYCVLKEFVAYRLDRHSET